MALKNLFDMVKADRYTADGREALIKAQEAETEDATRRTYQIGEISQSTGLQKTANGWVKPKSGKQPGAATKRDTDPQTYIIKKNDELRSMFQKEKDPAKKAAMKKALQKQASMMESESFAPGEEAGAKTGEGKSPSAGSINRTPERIKKETAIMEALNLSTGEDNNLHKMSDETIERLYKKAMSDTPAPKKENPTRTFTFNAGPDGKPVPGTGKQVQTFKTKEEAQKALNTQNAVAKYKDLPGPQRKDALFASTFEGISIGQTQNQMERQGWDLIKADDQVNVYGKPDGSKVTMKHDGKNITETNYEAPAAGAESKPAAKSENKTTIRQGPNTKTLNETPAEHVQKNLDAYTGYSPYDMEELVLKPSGYEKSRSTKGPDGVSSITYKKDGGDDIVLFFDKYGELKNAGTSQNREGVMQKMRAAEGYGHMKVVGDYDVYRVTSGPEKGKYKISKVGSLREVTMSEEKAADFLTSAAGKNKVANKDSAPRVLTGDCRIRIRKEKPALTGDTKIRVRK